MKTIPTITVSIFDNKWLENYIAILIMKQAFYEGQKQRYTHSELKKQNYGK